MSDWVKKINCTFDQVFRWQCPLFGAVSLTYDITENEKSSCGFYDN